MAEMPRQTFYHRTLGWHAPALRQGIIILAIGLVAGLVFARFQPWPVAVVMGWDLTAAAFLAVTWPMIIRADGRATRTLAQRTDPGRYAARLLLLAASLASLVGVGTVLAMAG